MAAARTLFLWCTSLVAFRLTVPTIHSSSYVPPITDVTMIPDLRTLHLILYDSITVLLGLLVLPNLERLTLENQFRCATSRIPIAGFTSLQERSACPLLHLCITYLRVSLGELVAFMDQLHELEILELDIYNLLDEILVNGLAKSLSGLFFLPALNRIVLKDSLLISDEYILDMVESRLGGTLDGVPEDGIVNELETVIVQRAIGTALPIPLTMQRVDSLRNNRLLFACNGLTDMEK